MISSRYPGRVRNFTPARSYPSRITNSFTRFLSRDTGAGRAAVLALEGGAGAAGSCGAAAVAAAGNPARPDMTSVADGGIRPADFMHVSCVGSKAAQACPSFPRA